MGKMSRGKGPGKVLMSTKLLWRHSKSLDNIDSTQPWEVWDTFEKARAASKALSSEHVCVCVCMCVCVCIKHTYVHTTYKLI